MPNSLLMNFTGRPHLLCLPFSLCPFGSCPSPQCLARSASLSAPPHNPSPARFGILHCGDPAPHTTRTDRKTSFPGHLPHLCHSDGIAKIPAHTPHDNVAWLVSPFERIGCADGHVSH